MVQAFKTRPDKIRSKLGILHSRYASTKGVIKESLAHPHTDEKNRVLVFHNGFIANY
jgi:glucosamine 6-phosphate synthetase-like amidotransferase/phosphosugar isomerase protein